MGVLPVTYLAGRHHEHKLLWCFTVGLHLPECFHGPAWCFVGAVLVLLRAFEACRTTDHALRKALLGFELRGLPTGRECRVAIALLADDRAGERCGSQTGTYFSRFTEKLPSGNTFFSSQGPQSCRLSSAIF